MMMKQYQLKLKDAQLRDLATGKGIMISPKVAGFGYSISMSPAKHAKMMSAHSQGKSCKLMLSPKELKANGVEVMEGGRINWRGIGRTLRRVGKKAGEFYRENIKPEIGPQLKSLVKRGVEEGLPLAVEGLTALVGAPEIGAVAAPFVRGYARRVSEPFAQAVGRRTGAFGTKKKKTTKRKKMMPMAMPVAEAEFVQPAHPKFGLQDTYWNFIAPNHPAFNPPLPPDNVNDGVVGRCGDLRSKMYFKRGGSMLSGTAMEPILPARDNSGSHMSYL
jgi:hypothetical protein